MTCFYYHQESSALFLVNAKRQLPYTFAKGTWLLVIISVAGSASFQHLGFQLPIKVWQLLISSPVFFSHNLGCMCGVQLNGGPLPLDSKNLKLWLWTDRTSYLVATSQSATLNPVIGFSAVWTCGESMSAGVQSILLSFLAADLANRLR